MGDRCGPWPNRRLAPGFVVDTRLEEGARIVTFANGLVARELIVDVDGGRKRVRLRFEVLTEQLRCNPGRVRGWAFATSIDHAVWCCEQGDQALGATVVEVARMIRALDV